MQAKSDTYTLAVKLLVAIPTYASIAMSGRLTVCQYVSGALYIIKMVDEGL
jgi:hypothetical protein